MTTITALSWLGTALQLAGAIILATRWRKPLTAYVVMLPGALIWLGIGLFTGDWPLAALQFGFCGINSIGVARWMT